jgi:hypothetical protein
MFARKYVPACFEWSVGGRWRRNKKQFDYDVESRAVLFNNYSMDLICMIFAQRMTSEFKKLDAHGNFLGHAMQKFGYERYINWRNKPVRNVRTGELLEPNLYIAIDAKSHDSSRTRKHKIIAMSLIRGCFPRGGVVDKFFFAMTYNLCNLKVVTPGGYTYLFQDGNPSGTPWTSWIATLTNWIDWCCIRHRCPHLKGIAIEVAIAGDDTEIKAHLPAGEQIDWGKVAKWAKKNCSLDIPIEEWAFEEFDSTKHVLRGQVDSEKVSFLKVSATNKYNGTHQMKHFANKDLAPKTVLKKGFCPLDNLVALTSVHSDAPEMREMIAHRLFQYFNRRDPTAGKDDRAEMESYEKRVWEENCKANRSYSLDKFMDRYKTKAHPGEPARRHWPIDNDLLHHAWKFYKTYGWVEKDLRIAALQELPFEFCGLPREPGMHLAPASEAGRFLWGSPALSFPLALPEGEVGKKGRLRPHGAEGGAWAQFKARAGPRHLGLAKRLASKPK